MTFLVAAESRTGWAARAILAASVGAIAWLTLTPVEPTPPLGPMCVFCGDLGGADFVLNVLLFVPLGIGLGLLRRRGRWMWAVPPLVSLAVELLQWSVVRGRDATVGDLLANSLGGTLGMMAAVWWPQLLMPNTRRARRMAAVSGVLAIGALATSGALLQPAVPFLVHWVQWLPRKNGYDVFGGQLDSLEVNGAPLAAFAAVDPIFRPEVAAAERNDVRAVVRPAGAPPRRIALIARLAAPMDERFMIGRHGDDFVYRVRLRAASAGFRVPIASLPGVFAANGSDAPPDGSWGAAVELEAELQPTGLRLHARGPDGEHERFVPLSPGVAWAYVAPRDVPLGEGFQWLNAAFLGFLAFPTMYWLAISASARVERERTVYGRAKTTVMLAIFLAAMASVHIVFGGAPFSPIEWAGVAAAGVTGEVAGRIVRARRAARHAVDASWSSAA